MAVDFGFTQYESITLAVIAFMAMRAVVKLGIEAMRLFGRLYERGGQSEVIAMERLESGENNEDA